jgi:sterol desaturase/sphingolipid hydroxylase (fatty acid hydroxylase superfamily)
LQPLYESAKAILAIVVPARLGPLGIVHPMVPSLIAVGGYFSLSLSFTLVDACLSGVGFVQAAQAQAENGKVARTSLERFGGKRLGLWRVVKSHVLFQLVLVPVYCMLIWKPQEMHMYPPPWFLADAVAKSPGAVPVLPASAPTVLEFILTYLFSLLSMDAGYGWWHFLAHRYKPIYKNVHAWHHEYHAPFAMVSQHAHPVELGVTGALAVCGPVACGAHPFVLWVSLLSSVVMSVDAHCGYELPWFLNARKLTFGIVGGMKHHDDHHRKPWGNFAPFFTYLDLLAGSNHEDVGPSTDMHA